MRRAAPARGASEAAVRRRPATALGATVALAAVLASAAPAGAASPASLDGELEPYLARYGLPALAAAVVKDGEVLAAGAIGTRRVGTRTPVRLDDRFHLGSDTKAMTALLAAMLVEEGRLRWDSTIGEVLPDLVPGMAAGVAGVTLTQLLSHTSGLPADNQAFADLLERSLAVDGNLDAMRLWLVREWRSQPLATTPGSAFAYANMNYVIAGAMIERVAGTTWDELITQRIFAPLQLRSAGLGNQASLGRVDAPLGHTVADGVTTAWLAGPNGDNPPVIGPAGIAHMSVLDFARWAGWNAGGGRRGPALVAPETLRRLHAQVIEVPARPNAAPGTPTGTGYALGWGLVTVDWAPGRMLQHSGSNGKNVAQVWVQPERDVAMVLVTNIGGQRAEDALRALAQELYSRYLAPEAPPLPTPTLPRRGAYFSGDTRRGQGE